MHRSRICVYCDRLISQIPPENQSFKGFCCIQAVTALLGHWGVNASNLTLLKWMTKLHVDSRVEEQTSKGTDVA